LGGTTIEDPRSRRFAYNLWGRYRLAVDEYDDLRRRQDDRCAVCGYTGKLFVDHDHMTGDIRGLLCMPCNIAIGQMRGNIVHLQGLIAYLDKPAVFSGDDLADRPRRLVQFLKQQVAALAGTIALLESRADSSQ